MKLYLFRDGHFARAGNTVMSAAPRDAVVKAFGGGGIKSTAGLHSVFGGAAVFQNDSKSDCYLGVWGARKSAKFRAAIKKIEKDIEIVEEHPPARLAWYQTEKRKPT